MDGQQSLLDIMFERVPMGVAIFDENLRLKRWNPTWAEFVERYTPKGSFGAELGAHFFEIAPGSESSVKQLLEAALRGETVRRDGVRMDSGGIVSYWDQVYSPIVENGKVIGLLDVAIDATERVVAYQTLEQRVVERTREIERRRQVAESLRDILAVLNSEKPLDEILDFIAAQACQVLGTDTAAIYRFDSSGQCLRVQAAWGLPAEYVENVSIPVDRGRVGQAILNRQPLLIEDFVGFVQANDLRQSETTRNVLMKRYGSLLGFPLVVKDEVYGGVAVFYPEKRPFMPEEVALARSFSDQVALAIENASLRDQAEEAAVAAERNRLARDLHDSVTQTLFSASLIAEVLPKLWERKPEEGRRRLEELRQLSRGALAEMRALLLELRPAALIEAEMPELLRHLVEATIGRGRVPVELKVTGEEFREPLHPDVQIAFYRIAQEALNNVAKHAEASQARVLLSYGDREVSLAVSDNGKGFDPARVDADHFGVGIMHERAEAVGAELEVESSRGEGTTVRLTWHKPEASQRQVEGDGKS